MTWLTRIALKKRWITFLVVALLTGTSVWATITLKQELIPDIDFPVTSVVTIYPQASPEDVASAVSIPVESAISGIQGLETLISTSTAGSSYVFALFDFGSDMDKINATIKENLTDLSLPAEVRNLPATTPQIAENPMLYSIDINMMPVVRFGLSGDLSADELYDIAVTEFVPRLESIEGVYHVGIEGGSSDKVLVSLNPEKLTRYNVSISQIAAMLTTQQYNSLNQIENTAIGTTGLVLSDIAGVKMGPAPGTTISRTNGKPSISISVMKEAEANTVLVANAVVEEAENIRGNLSDDIEITTVMDQSEFIEKSIGDLTRNAIIGFVLATIVVFLFLMAFRASIVTAISIPLSILIGFLAMRCFGITINILTLSAMAIVVGRVIDNSIVVLEVIYRRMQQGEAFREAAVGGVSEVAVPITSATLATIIIFVPLFFIGGIISELFIPFSITIIFALVASLLVALMVVPPLSNFPVSGKADVKKKEPRYQRLYTAILQWSLKHRAATLAIATVLFFGSFALVPVIGTSFIPSMSEKMITVDIEMPPESDLTASEETAVQVEEIISENPEVLTYQTTVGLSSSLIGGLSALSGSGTNNISVVVYLTSEADSEQEAAELRRDLLEVADEDAITVTTMESRSTQLMGSGLDISVRGDNYEDVAIVSSQLLSELEETEGLAEITLSLASTEARLGITPVMTKVMSSGLPLDQIQQLQQEFMLMMYGGTISEASIDGRSHEIYLEGISQYIDNLETAKNLRIGYPQSVPLGDIATVSLDQRPDSIMRIDEKLAASISGLITAKDVGAVNQKIQAKIDNLPDIPGIEVTMGGIAEMMQESFSSMFIATIIAIVLAYLVLVVSFRSFLIPVIIMISLPLATIGALLGLLISGQTIGISAMMGVLMLVGIVLTNAIVLISSVEQFRRKGIGTYDALVEGGSTRLRPILMTALTTMIAMLPLALGLGEGTVMSAELAVVVIGGLFTSTLLTLLVIPVIYSLLSRMRHNSTIPKA
jgi:HAE1 family hydrophobic/amphiphilic exporter-1